MPIKEPYHCKQCGTETIEKNRGYRLLKPCPECNDVTTYEHA